MTVAIRDDFKPALIPTEHEMAVFQIMAKQAVASKMYRGVGDESGVMMIMLTARELGIPAMQALNGAINIIQGKVELSARLMNALMRRAGIVIQIDKVDDNECRLIGIRDTVPTRVTYSIEDAKKAGLVKVGGGWTKNPEDMLFARAISRLARRIAPDIIGGCYVEGEIQEAMNVKVEPIPDAEEPKISIESFLGKFPKEDEQIVMDYIALFAKHFNKTEEEAIQLCYNEPLIIEKVGQFKAKRAKNENST